MMPFGNYHHDPVQQFLFALGDRDMQPSNHSNFYYMPWSNANYMTQDCSNRSQMYKLGKGWVESFSPKAAAQNYVGDWQQLVCISTKTVTS
jgi:hypothetical protein